MYDDKINETKYGKMMTDLRLPELAPALVPSFGTALTESAVSLEVTLFASDFARCFVHCT